VLNRYVGPARAAGRPKLVVRAGDVHQEMGLSSAMPAVCSALGSNKFKELAGVILGKRTGPANGSNVYFEFDLTGSSSPNSKPVRNGHHLQEAFYPSAVENVDVRGAVVLVSCVKSKRSKISPARALYTSAWFSKVRDLVETSGARWLILSAKYGLVLPDEPIAPYDFTLNDCGVAERREWASRVLEKLIPQLAGERRVVIFAGQRYREFLMQALLERGLKAEVPMADLRQGEQLAWLSQQR
jgi:hypothetical protein